MSAHCQRIVLALGIAAAMGMVPGFCAPGIRIDDRIETYRIDGVTSGELRTRMHQLGPQDVAEHSRYAANTHWNVAWHYWFRSDATGCRIDRSDVSISTVMTLPQWGNEGSGSAALRAEWASFSAHLKQHEAGHRSNGIQAAQTVQQTIDTIGPNRDCTVLGKAIDAAGYAAIARANRADIEYDATTHHGQTQGAVLP